LARNCNSAKAGRRSFNRQLGCTAWRGGHAANHMRQSFDDEDQENEH
jgi:hypothetical protein